MELQHGDAAPPAGLPDVIAEICDLVGQGALSEVQGQILLARYQGATYEALKERFSLSGATALTHCLVRTATARFWVPGMSGSGEGYLAPCDMERFRTFITGACDEVNCISVHVALSVAFAVEKDRLSRARQILLLLNCPKLLSHISEPGAPSRSWINGVCESLDIRICRAQELEVARRMWCDYDTIVRWFLEFSILFDRPVELLFNMDETYVNSAKSLHCLAPAGRKPLTASLPVMPHMTGAVTIHAGGERFLPLIVLPKKKTLRSLEAFEGHAFFASSTSGWMTRNLFRFYALTFVAQLQQLRAKWPDNLRKETALLFVDGHQSRWDFRACLIFWLFDVDLLTFPGHCTHLLQMFDVSIASALKMQMKKELASSRFAGFLRTLNVSDFSLHKEMTREMRSSMIASFLTAYERVCTSAACRESFAVTGVAPYDPVRVLASDYAVPPPRDGVLPRRTGKANSKWLTSEECLREMFIEENGREPTPEDLLPNLAEILHAIQTASLDQGLPLSNPPDILIETWMEKCYRLCRVADLRP